MENASEARSLRHRRMVPKVTSGKMVNAQHTDTPDTGDNSPQTATVGNNNLKVDTSYVNNRHSDLHPSSELAEVTRASGESFHDDGSTQPLLTGDTSESDLDQSSPADSGVRIHKPEDDSSWQIALQVFFPYMVAGLGMVGAGVVLDVVQHWQVFTEVSEVFILVPALLGLKGNLEMTLASRLSTQANLGNIDSKKEQWQMIFGNIALTQAQAIVVGFLASIAAMVFGWIPEGKFNISHGLLLCASSVTTAALASFVLGSIMVGVVIGSRKCNINPDNVATPIAASLGDLTTLTVLASVSSVLFDTLQSHFWLCPTILAGFLCLTPLWCVISHYNKYTNEVLYVGWTPVIGAMVISSVGGLILDFAVSSFSGIAVFQPVINGVGGNLVAVQASRLSTALHQTSKPGTPPPDSVHGCPNPCSTFFGSTVSARTARVLMFLVVPGHLVFMYTIHYMQAGHTSITISFALTYLGAALLQVVILLYTANWLVHWLWMRGNDPDNFSIPYLTAIGDLLGTLLLLTAFLLLYAVGDKSIDVTD